MNLSPFSIADLPLDLPGVQRWVRLRFGDLIDSHSSIEGIARLLEQSGQLAESIITRGSRDVRKELADVLLVLFCLAEKEGVDLAMAVRHELAPRSAGDYLIRGGGANNGGNGIAHSPEQ